VRPLLLAMLLAPAAARAEPGLTAATFLQHPLGSRAAGMGGAFTAVTGSIDSAQYNPAGLATISSPTVTSTYLSGFGGSRFGLLQYAHPTKVGTFSAGALYYTAGRIDLVFSDGTSRSVNAEQNTAWTGSYAAKPLPWLALGGTFRHLELELAQTAKASSNQFDFGGLLKLPVYGLSFGASYQYLGPNITYESVGDPSPKTFRAGLAFRFPDVDPTIIDPGVQLDNFDATIAADVVKILYEKSSPRIGLEMGLLPAFLTRIALRAGWVFNRDSDSLTIGAGVEHGNLRFDYAFGRSRELENTQQLTLSYIFGKLPEGWRDRD
jgi:hypothetical protein